MRIEQRLKHLANENPNYSLLWAQWEFDKKLLARALNTISRDFPHYSYTIPLIQVRSLLRLRK